MRRKVLRSTVLTCVSGLLVLYLMFPSDSGIPSPALDTLHCDGTRDFRKRPLAQPMATPDNNTQRIVNDLFPENNKTLPKYPYFVTAISSAYFLKGKCLARHVLQLRTRYPEIRLVVFNLGLTRAERQELSEMCSCDIRDFPFQYLPSHVKVLKGYSFKPIAIQLVAREHPFVIWADASVRFVSSDVDTLFKDAEHLGVLVTAGYGSITVKTQAETFRHLGEDPCIYKDLHEIQATFIVVYENSFIKKHIMRPWVQCALTVGCMMPVDGPDRYLSCDSGGPECYHMCHRFDQSVLGILVNRVYEQDVGRHKLNEGSVFKFCRGATERWWAPRIYNELRLTYVSHCNRTLNCLDD